MHAQALSPLCVASPAFSHSCPLPVSLLSEDCVYCPSHLRPAPAPAPAPTWLKQVPAYALLALLTQLAHYLPCPWAVGFA